MPWGRRFAELKGHRLKAVPFRLQMFGVDFMYNLRSMIDDIFSPDNFITIHCFLNVLKSIASHLSGGDDYG